jgi:hypothetical protein
MNFWKTLRLIGSLIVLAIALLTVLLALRHGPDSSGDTAPARPHPAMLQPSGTTGL